jgi:type IV secretory pathway VirB3-like protein
MKTKRLAIFLLTRMTLLAVFIAPVWAVGRLLAAPEIAIAGAMLIVNLTYFRFQEDLVDRIAPRYSVAQLSGR